MSVVVLCGLQLVTKPLCGQLCTGWLFWLLATHWVVTQPLLAEGPGVVLQLVVSTGSVVLPSQVTRKQPLAGDGPAAVQLCTAPLTMEDGEPVAGVQVPPPELHSTPVQLLPAEGDCGVQLAA